MAILDKDDMVKGTITFPKEDIPKAEFFVKKTITVAENDVVSITGNFTSAGSTNSVLIFGGRVDDVDLGEVQKIQVVSKAEEIDTIRPKGEYGGYTEVILGELINDYCNEITCTKTESTNTINPNGDHEGGAWTTPIHTKMHDSSDATYTQSTINGTEFELDIAPNGLSTSYNYEIYQIDVIIRSQYTGAESGARCKVCISKDGTSWEDWKDAGVNGSWITDTLNFIGLSWTQDDVDSMKVKVQHSKILGSPTLQVSELTVKIYYRYYANLSKGVYKSNQKYSGEQTLRQIFEWGKLQELHTWYFTPALEFKFNDGDVDSGVDISSTDKIGRVLGKKQIKKFDKIELLGGISDSTGLQISASAGVGNIIYKDTYANIKDETILGNLATQILANKQTYPLTVDIFRRDSTKGMIQPGEEVTINAGIHFKESSRTITAGQYKIDQIKYYLVNGTYKMVDLKLSDILVFKRQKQPDKPNQDNSSLINQLSISGGDGVSILNDLTDVTIDGTPANNELVSWDSTSSKWTNQTAAEAGLSVSDHNHAHNDLSGLNDGDAYEHITQTQKNALHAIYTDAEAIQAVEDTGLVLSAAKVILSADADLNFTFGRASIGSPTTDNAYFYHRNCSTSVKYALRQTSAGQTHLNSATGQTLYFKVNNVAKASVTVDGFQIGAGARVTTIENNDGLGTSDVKLCTQGNTKAYVDNNAYSDAEAVAAVLAADDYVKNTTDSMSGNLTVAGTIWSNNIDPSTDVVGCLGSDTRTWMRVYTRDIYDASNAQILGTDSAGKIDQIAEINANVTMSATKIFTLGGELVFNRSLGADGRYGGITRIMTVDQNTFGFGGLLHLDTDGHWIDADKDGIGYMPCSAIAVQSGVGSKKIMFLGVIRDDTWNFTQIGKPVYVGDSGAATTDISGYTVGDVIQVVGIALSADSMLFNPSLDWVVKK